MSGTNGGHSGANPKLTSEQIEDCVSRYAAGESISAISASYDVTNGAVLYHLHKRGVKTRQALAAEARPAPVKPPPPPAEDLSWQEEAICRQTDPEEFFPEKGGSTRQAKRVCVGCPVRAECLDYALRHNERYGIWGGLSERERYKLANSAA